MNQPIAGLAIPWVVKRNLALFATSQTFTGAGMQFAYSLGPLMVIALTGSNSLAGVSVGLIALSRFFVAYPVGKITDLYGRKPGVLFGQALALVGSLMIGFSMSLRSPATLFVGMLVFGMGMSASQQLRVAATDMFPAHMRAQALGYLALGSLGGLIIAPIVVNGADVFAHDLGGDPLATPWFLLPALIIGGMVVVRFVRPDPKEIGQRLGDYYPGYTPPARDASRPIEVFRASSLLSRAATRFAVVSNGAAQGNMSIVMVLTSLVLRHHGHSLGAIAISHTFHSAGMFAFTIPLGKLADRFGRERVMLPGIVVTLIGAGLVTFVPTYLFVTLGTFLVGIGWAAVNVSATALIADNYETAERGRAIGVNDSFAAGVSVVAALVTGPLIDMYGLPAAGLTAVILGLPPLFLLAGTRLARRGGLAGAET